MAVFFSVVTFAFYSITTSAPAPVFRFAPPPSTPSFGALAGQSAPSFGSLAQQGPGFGSQPSSFSGFGQQPQPGGETTTLPELFLFLFFPPFLIIFSCHLACYHSSLFPTVSHSTAPFFQQLYNFSHCTVFITSFFTLTVFQTWKRKVALLLCNRNFLSIATKQVFCCVNYTFRVDCASHEDFKVVNFLIWQHNASLCETYPRSTSLSNMIKTKDDKGWMNTFYVSWANETERGSL